MSLMMMTNPITPPPELVKQWASEFYGTTISPGEAAIYVANQAAQWGADQELEACCDTGYPNTARTSAIYAVCLKTKLAHCPPPRTASKFEEASASRIIGRHVYNRDKIEDSTYDTIRRALEALDD
jgi:hypothetical protein